MISFGEGNGNPLQYSCLENPMDRGAWQATVHGVTRVRHDLVTKPPPLTLTLEQHRFEMHVFTYMQIFFFTIKYCRYYRMGHWLNPWTLRADYELNSDFPLLEGWYPNPCNCLRVSCA